MKKKFKLAILFSLILIIISLLTRPEETIKMEVIEPVYTSFKRW